MLPSPFGWRPQSSLSIYIRTQVVTNGSGLADNSHDYTLWKQVRGIFVPFFSFFCRINVMSA